MGGANVSMSMCSFPYYVPWSAEIARPDNAASDQTEVLEKYPEQSSESSHVYPRVFDSGAYSLQFLCAVRHSVSTHTWTLHYSRVTIIAAAATRTRTRPVRRRPRQQRRLQRRRNQHQPLTTAVKCSSWRHVLASHWCCADMM